MSKWVVLCVYDLKWRQHRLLTIKTAAAKHNDWHQEAGTSSKNIYINAAHCHLSSIPNQKCSRLWTSNSACVCVIVHARARALLVCVRVGVGVCVCVPKFVWPKLKVRRLRITAPHHSQPITFYSANWKLSLRERAHIPYVSGCCCFLFFFSFLFFFLFFFKDWGLNPSSHMACCSHLAWCWLKK